MRGGARARGEIQGSAVRGHVGGGDGYTRDGCRIRAVSPTARFLLRLPRHRPDWLSCSPRLTGSLLCSAHGVIRTMRRAPCPKAAFARPRGGQLTALLGGSASMLGTVAVLLACLMYPTPLASCYATRCLPTLAWLTVHGDNEDCCEIPSTGVVWNADNLQFHRKSFSRLPLGQSALYLFLSLCLPICGVVLLYAYTNYRSTLIAFLSACP